MNDRPPRCSTKLSNIIPGSSRRAISRASGPEFLEPHGGELDGFFLLRGDQDKLARIRSSEEFERLTVRGQLIIENLGIVGAALGGRLMSQLSIFGEQVEELT